MADVKKIATRDSYGNALAELAAEHDDLIVFDADLAAFAAPFFPAKGEQPDGSWYRGMVMGGNSVKFDFAVTEKFFPQTLANMDYRVIDISSIGELVRRWNLDAWNAMPAKASDHTAMTDIRAGVDELRYYRRCGLTPAG